MVSYNIAASQLTRNEISSLAKILETIFKFYWDNPTTVPSVKDYLLDLSTIVGLGFIAVLMHKTFISFYQERLETFIRLRDFQKQKAKEAIPLLSLSLAEMVDVVSQIPYEMNQLPYAEFYYRALKKVLSHLSILLAGKELEAEKFLKKLQKLSNT